MCSLSVFGCPVSHLSIVTVLHLCDYALQLSIPLLPYHVDIVVFSFIARQYADA